MLVECFCSLTSLPFTDYGIYNILQLILSELWCQVVAALRVAMDTSMFSLKLTFTFAWLQQP